LLMKKGGFINKRSRAVKRGEVAFDEHGRPMVGTQRKSAGAGDLGAWRQIQRRPSPCSKALPSPLVRCGCCCHLRPCHSSAPAVGRWRGAWIPCEAPAGWVDVRAGNSNCMKAERK
jgi:hypothetical protein